MIARLSMPIAILALLAVPQDLRAEAETVAAASDPTVAAASDATAVSASAAAAAAVEDSDPVAGRGWSFEPEPEPISAAQISQRDRSLIERPDRRRPEDGLTLDVFGRPLLFGVALRTRTRYENGRFDKGIGTIDQTTFNGQIEFDVFYPFTESISVFLGGKALMMERWASEDPGRFDVSETRLERNEMWLFLGNILGSPFSAQVGGQRFFDRREWWWDQNLDAIRLRFDLEDLHLQFAASEGMVPLGTGESANIDPEDADITRLLGEVSYRFAGDHRVDLFALHQNDHSKPHEIGVLIDAEEEDEVDSQLTWFGLSAAGRFRTERAGRFRYWLNVAGVLGDETFYDMTNLGERRFLLPGRTFEHKVRGVGVDAWASWQLPLIGQPALTLGYAYGSGRGDMDDRSDGGFRQTGLQDNNDHFFGVNNFRYYGPLFDPELSNMHILSAALGFRYLDWASVEFVYHYYKQDRTAPYVRDLGFKLDPAGGSRSLGDEWDLIFGFQWPHVELELEGSIFRAGAAYRQAEVKSEPRRTLDLEDELVYQATLEIRVNF